MAINKEEKQKIIEWAETNSVVDGSWFVVNVAELKDFINAMPEESGLKACPACDLQWYTGTGEIDGPSIPMVDGHVVISPLDSDSIRRHLNQIAKRKFLQFVNSDELQDLAPLSDDTKATIGSFVYWLDKEEDMPEESDCICGKEGKHILVDANCPIHIMPEESDLLEKTYYYFCPTCKLPASGCACEKAIREKAKNQIAKGKFIDYHVEVNGVAPEDVEKYEYVIWLDQGGE